jgi:hypothetical protein
MLKYFWRIILGILSSFAQKHGQTLLSPDDSSSDYLVNKLIAGDDVSIELQNDEENNQKLVFSVPRKIVQTFSSDGDICKKAYLVLVDASKNHVKLNLPPASSYSGQLSIVCLDPTNGIELLAESIFDETNTDLKSKGDGISLVTDGKTWYAVGKYTANWYF